MNVATTAQPARPGARRALRLAAVACLAAFAGGWTGPVGPSLRLPRGDLANEYWDVVARLDTGHLVIAQTWLSNLGPAGRMAGAFGQLVAPDGRTRPFKRSEAPGQFRIDGGRLDLHSVALEPVGPPRRFEVGRDELAIELALAGGGAPASAGSVTDACPFEVLEPGARADVRLREQAAAPVVSTQGRVALTHRWTQDLESECVLRRLEVFVLEREFGLYFAETTAPDGTLHRWLVAQRGDRVLFAGDPGDAAVRWSDAAGGFAPPASARFAAAGLEAQVRFAGALASVDPTERLPGPVQWLMSSRTRPRLTWLRAPFEIALDGADGVRSSSSGEAVAKVSYLNPLPPAGEFPRVAHTEGTP